MLGGLDDLTMRRSLAAEKNLDLLFTLFIALLIGAFIAVRYVI